LFNRGFSDYQVTLQLDEVAFREHVASNDIDLGWSRVAVDQQPVALALVAHRGSQAWIGGMGTAPSHRRRGLGERLLRDSLEGARSHGAESVWLEVIEGNQRAIGLYEKLGFETVRRLIVWTLSDGAAAPGPELEVVPLELAAARAWITEHRAEREPWQRADESLDRMQAAGARLAALAAQREGETVGAIIHRLGVSAVTILQGAALDGDAAFGALGAVAAGRGARLSNLAEDSSLVPALERLSAEPVIRQLEMRVSL
jgi:GNAT superfamily N-acetyltransferase